MPDRGFGGGLQGFNVEAPLDIVSDGNDSYAEELEREFLNQDFTEPNRLFLDFPDDADFAVVDADNITNADDVTGLTENVNNSDANADDDTGLAVNVNISDANEVDDIGLTDYVDISDANAAEVTVGNAEEDPGFNSVAVVDDAVIAKSASVTTKRSMVLQMLHF